MWSLLKRFSISCARFLGLMFLSVIQILLVCLLCLLECLVSILSMLLRLSFFLSVYTSSFGFSQVCFHLVDKVFTITTNVIGDLFHVA